MKYRKKQVEIDAIQFVGTNKDEITEFMFSASSRFGITGDGSVVIFINTLEGEMVASVGDWIIKGVKGEFYPCKPDIFAATYECAE